MTSSQFKTVTKRYGRLRIAIVGDFCLDRYLEIDPARAEISLETNLPVRNVVNVRPQPGGAGTILNNLVTLGVGKIFAVGFCGDDGEGYELRQALSAVPSVSLEHFLQTPARRTFTYTKPLILRRGKPPEELNRLDLKNWTPTPKAVRERLVRSVRALASKVDAFIVLEQVDVAETGVVTSQVLEALHAACRTNSRLLVLADSRRGLRSFPPLIFKMNAAELAVLVGAKRKLRNDEIAAAAAKLSRENGQPVFVTLAQRGILGALPTGEVEHALALPVRGPIDIVGAGDSVTANLTTALAAGAGLREALELANAAASVVVHKLGTTGTASIREIRAVLPLAR